MANSKNTNLFYKLYSTPGKIAQSGFVCNSAVDETDTSFDISGSKGVITDSNGDEIASVDMSQIHAAGITEYYTETKIIGPQSAYLLQGNVTGETYAAQFFPVPKYIQAQDGYESFVNVKFCIQYVSCSKIHTAEIDTYKMRNAPGDVCEIIQNRFNELGIPVAVSLRTLDVCDCNHADCTKNNQIDYLVFQSSLLGYQFFVYNSYMTPIDYSYENFDETWADYTESPFVYAVIDFDTVLDIIRSVSPRRRGETEYKPYGQVPCDLYRWLITLAPMAVNDAEVFMRNYNGLKRFAELAGPDGIILDENYQTFVSVAHIYPDIYAYYYGLDGSLCTKYNIHDLLKIISAVSAYVNNSNVAGPYELIEDFDKRIYPLKYPNGAFRGVVLIPDWPGDGYEALKIAHVADSIIVNERVAVPKGMRVEGYVCNGCKDVFIRHEAEVKVNCLLQSELEVYNECACCWPVRKIVSNDGIYNSLDDDIWTYTLHHALETTGGWSMKPDYAGDVPPVTNSGNSIWSDATPVNPTPKPEPIEKKSYEDYVEESRTPSKYDWLANIPGMGPMTNMESVKRTVGLYRYMQHLAENNGWLNCGEGYMIIGPEDDYQSRKHNLQNSLLVYNPNDVPIRVSFMVFS